MSDPTDRNFFVPNSKATMTRMISNCQMLMPAIPIVKPHLDKWLVHGIDRDDQCRDRLDNNCNYNINVRHPLHVRL